MVKRAMTTIFERVEAAYLEHALETYKAVVRPTDIERLLKKFPELVHEEIKSINTYFGKNRTLQGLGLTIEQSKD